MAIKRAGDKTTAKFGVQRTCVIHGCRQFGTTSPSIHGGAGPWYCLEHWRIRHDSKASSQRVGEINAKPRSTSWMDEAVDAYIEAHPGVKTIPADIEEVKILLKRMVVVR